MSIQLISVSCKSRKMCTFCIVLSGWLKSVNGLQASQTVAYLVAQNVNFKDVSHYDQKLVQRNYFQRDASNWNFIFEVVKHWQISEWFIEAENRIWYCFSAYELLFYCKKLIFSCSDLLSSSEFSSHLF